MFSIKQLGLFLLGISANMSATAQNMALPASSLSFLPQATLTGAVPADKKINFTVWLKLRNKAELDQFAADVYNPVSPVYQHFLTSAEFNYRYAPAPEIEKTIQHYFSAQGMQAKIVNHSLRVTSSAQQVERLFKIRLNEYRYHNKTFYAHVKAPVLKAELAQHVLEISGLNNFKQYHPAARRRPRLNHGIQPANINMVWDSYIPIAQPTNTSLAGFTGAQLQTTYTLAQIKPVRGTAINGAGQTLVIIDSCGRNSRQEIRHDANLYNDANGITQLHLSGAEKNFAVIDPDGSDYTSCGTSGVTGWEEEIALDVEASHTIAPGANIVLVLSRNDGAPLDTAVHDVIHTLTNNNYTIAGFPNAYVVSNSWGLSEYSAGSSPAMETVLETAAVQGISFNFSTGDCGDDTYNSSWPCTADPYATVEYPASSMYTTAVGGTSMFVDSQWNYAFETLWGSYYNGGFYGGTTGGISQYHGPVAWQDSIRDFTAGGYTSGTVGDYNKRAVPDISMLADPYTGLTIYERNNSFVYGGTSLACPLFSGTLTLINQARMLLNGSPHPVGQAAPYLYTNNSVLLKAQALRLISPPHRIIDGALPPPPGAPLSAFNIFITGYNYELTFGWDSSLTLAPENQFWNDGVGVGSPNLPNFVMAMVGM